MKHTVKLVKTTSVYISNETCEIVNVSPDEAMLSSFIGDNKYTFIHLCTLLATFTGKTYKELYKLVDAFAEKNQDYDFHSIIMPKN